MKIELSTTEIKQAISEYMAKHLGFNLAKSNIVITFSTGRIQGTIAAVDITPKEAAVNAVAEAATIPGYSDAAEDAPIVTGEEDPVVDPIEAAEAAATETTEEVVETADVAAAEPAPEATEAEAVEAAPVEQKKSTATLFGKPAA